MRVNPNLTATVIDGIQQSDQALQTAYREVTTGQKVNQPSDNPAASAAYMTLQAESANIDQYSTNASTALSQAQTADSVLTSIVSLLNSAITVGTEGANSTTSASDRTALSANVTGILANIVSLANTTFGGVALFGGTATGATAFTADASSSTGYTYNGNSTADQIPIGDSLKVQVNIPGDTLFTNPKASVLGAVSGLASALASGNSASIGAATTNITAALNYVSQQHVVYGSTINHLNSQEEYLAQEKITLTSQETSLVGVDAATAAENLAQAEVANSAVYTASAKVLQNNLLTYLR
ncbi:MAG: flagellar hook-associated protein FlgL [Janthinobacterium lividum]